MKCPECANDKSMHHESCPHHGTGEQSPVDKIPVCPKCESLNQCQHCGHCTKCCSIEITTLEASLSVARGDAEKLCELEQIRTAELNDTLDRALSAEKRSREYAAECDKYIGELEELQAENAQLKNKQEEYHQKFNELSLQAVEYRDENERLERCRQITDKFWQKLTEDNERYLSAIKTFCARSKWAVDSWKKQDYIAALFEIANQESR